MFELLQYIKSENKVYIYGKGSVGQALFKYLKLRGLEEFVQGFVVSHLNDEEPWFMGKCVVEIYDLKEKDPNASIIVSVLDRYRAEIVGTLQKFQFNNYKILQDEQIEILNRLRPIQKLKYQVHITEHCNLNCRGCFHCSPLAKKEFMPLEEYERDVKRLSDLFNGQAEQIQLLGGEPLLHPDIIGFFEITRRYFSDAKIILVTNGICLPQMKEDFYLAAKQYKIEIRPTYYPIKIDYEAIRKKVESYGIRYNYFWVRGTMDETGNKILENFHFDIEGLQPIEDNFHKCYRGNTCITLHHGKMYSCVIGANLYHFKNYFGLDQIEISDENGIDIYAAKSADEIAEFLTRPMPVCRYCKIVDEKTLLPFEISKRDIREWL